jgi:hypothetical protein
MSYDLVVFDPSSAPDDPEEVLRWYERQSEEADDVSEVSGPHLRSFFLELVQRFPALNGPHATEDFDDPRVTDYAFGPLSIYM